MILSIVNDFCETPGPRFKSEGNFSGEEFRDEILEPKFLLAKRNNEKLIIKLDGVYGYPASFLDEVFGGLSKKYSCQTVLDILSFESDDISLIHEIINCIKFYDIND